MTALFIVVGCMVGAYFAIRKHGGWRAVVEKFKGSA